VYWPIAVAKKRETRLLPKCSQRVSTSTPSHKGGCTKAHQMNYGKIMATILLPSTAPFANLVADGTV
jgi:hypothetical protein